MKGATNSDVIQIVEEYVAKKKVVEVIESQRKKIPQKANQILKELVYLWDEQVPGFGLFGVEQTLLSELEGIRWLMLRRARIWWIFQKNPECIFP
jgi:hypothetical protein